jgi:ankyrin repeat protein
MMDLNIAGKWVLLVFIIAFITGCGATLNESITYHNLKIARLNIAEGENINGQEDGIPLHKAVWAKDTAICRELIAAGAVVNARDQYDGSTALHIAARIGSPEIIKMLLGAGANINVQEDAVSLSLNDALARADSSGDTPLTIAVKEKNANIVKMLLEAGADKSIVVIYEFPSEGIIAYRFDDIGRTIYVEINGRVLQKHQAKRGRALDIAKEKGFVKIIELLK